MDHGVGIDTGEAMLVRGGVHGEDANDIISIGSAPNIAAKLSDLRRAWPLLITGEVHDCLSDASKLNSTGDDMWTSLGTKFFGGKLVPYFGSTYTWEP